VLLFSVYGCMLCLVCYLFVISTSVIDCLRRFVPEMTCYVLSGTLNLAKLNLVAQFSYLSFCITLGRLRFSVLSVIYLL